MKNAFGPYIRSLLDRLRSDRKGAVLMLAAFMMPVLIVATGVGLDLSMYMMKQRDLQTAADAAVLAAAYDYLNGRDDQDELEAIAVLQAQANGYNPDNNGSLDLDVSTVDDMIRLTVLVGEQPTSYFASLIDGMMLPDQLGAKAVAELQGGEPAPVCVMSLGDGYHSVHMNSNAYVKMPGCAIQVNSAHNAALHLDSNARIEEAEKVCVAGDYTYNSNAKFNPEPDTGCNQVQDPYVDLPEPSTTQPCKSGNFVVNANKKKTFTPGRYCNNFILNSNSQVTLEPGLYIIDGGTFAVNSNATLSGTGVTFFFTKNTNININSNAKLYLSAPTTGIYKDILFYTARDYTNLFEFNSNAQAEISGVIYFPSTDFRSNSNFGVGDGGEHCIQIVARNVLLNSNARIDFIPSETCSIYQNSGSSTPKSVRLVY